VSPPSSRRAVLRAGLSLAVAGLTGVGLAGCDLLSPPAPGEVPAHALDGFLADTVALRDRYAASITAMPELASRLTSVHDAHQAHVEALAAALGRQAPPSAGDADAPAGRAATIAALVAAEKAGRDAAVAACVAASGRLAPLLGSIAAARASHVEVVK
jgi:hypothetical protein